MSSQRAALGGFDRVGGTDCWNPTLATPDGQPNLARIAAITA